MQAPLASPWAGTTIGGLVATNLNSPQRLRYGALRDLVMATTVALADGRVIRAGRPVVKNVAGYDLPKLFIGSHGTLGAAHRCHPQALAPATRTRAPCPARGRSATRFGLGGGDRPHLDGGERRRLVQRRRSARCGRCALCAALYAGRVGGGHCRRARGVASLRWKQPSARLLIANDLHATTQWADFLPAAATKPRWCASGFHLGAWVTIWAQLPAAVQAQAAWCADVGNHLLYARVDSRRRRPARHGWPRCANRPWAGWLCRGHGDTPSATGIAGATPPTAWKSCAPSSNRWDAKGILNPGDFMVG